MAELGRNNVWLSTKIKMMMNRKIILFCSVLVILVSCNKKKFFDGPDAYSDDFENYLHADSMIDGNDEQWSYFQKSYAGNAVNVDTVIVHSGNQSIKCEAAAFTEEGGASKASFTKQHMAFYEGEIVSVEAWYYIEGTADADWFFIMDLEEQAAIGAGPGMRLAVVDSALVIEHKYLEPNIYQPDGEEVLVPRNTWFHVRFETLLSQKKKGNVKVWQNDTLIIEAYNHVSLPSDILYFQQGTKGMYTSIEFGATANSAPVPIVIYVDDISIKVQE
jgi:hypothetical protein